MDHNATIRETISEYIRGMVEMSYIATWTPLSMKMKVYIVNFVLKIQYSCEFNTLPAIRTTRNVPLLLEPRYVSCHSQN